LLPDPLVMGLRRLKNRRLFFVPVSFDAGFFGAGLFGARPLL